MNIDDVLRIINVIRAAMPLSRNLGHRERDHYWKDGYRSACDKIRQAIEAKHICCYCSTPYPLPTDCPHSGDGFHLVTRDVLMDLKWNKEKDLS
jgi:hypothetical protein